MPELILLGCVLMIPALVSGAILGLVFRSTLLKPLHRLVGSYVLLAVWWLGTAPTILWLCIYGIERWSGVTPSYDDWYAAGNRHGPWDDTTAALFVLPASVVVMPIVLSPAALVAGAYGAFRSGSWGPLVKGTAIAMVIVGYAACLIFTVGWTVD